MFRFFLHAVPLLVLLLFLFSVVIGYLDVGPARSLTVLSLQEAPFRLVLGTWLLEAFGLVGLYLLVEGRSRLWWLDGLMVGWVAWIFRGPLLVVTVVVAAGRSQAPWFSLAVGWWVLYSICGLALALLARRETAKAKAAAILDKTPTSGGAKPRTESTRPAVDETPSESLAPSRQDEGTEPAEASEPAEPENQSEKPSEKPSAPAEDR